MIMPAEETKPITQSEYAEIIAALEHAQLIHYELLDKAYRDEEQIAIWMCLDRIAGLQVAIDLITTKSKTRKDKLV